MRRFHKLALWLILCLVVSPAAAQELDTARQAYAAMSDGLGFPTVLGLDTTLASYTYVRNSLNEALRAVQTFVPWIGKDTITVASNTFIYALNGTLVQPPARRPSEPWRPSGYWIVVITPDGSVITGIEEKSPDQIGIVPYVVSSPYGFSVIGSDLLFWPPDPVGSTIYVYGPGEVTPITGGGSLLTSMPETEARWAAVNYAIATIARENGDDAKAQEYRAKFDAYVASKKQSVMGVQ